MNWGRSIILAFFLFAVFIAVLVTVCMRQDVNLVSHEYYKEELAYQRQIDRVAQTAMLTEIPVIEIEDKNLLKVSYSDFGKIEQGVLQLFRPSDPQMDKKFEVRSSPNELQYFSTAGMARGMYRARFRWTMNGEDFFIEQMIQL